MDYKTYNVIVNDVKVVSDIMVYEYARGICRGINLTYENSPRYLRDQIKVELETVTWDVGTDDPINTARKTEI